MMFQSYALWPHMTVAGNIGYGLRMRGWKSDAIAERVDEMLKLLQLEGFGARPVTQLSGGQRQRVALGRALAVDPHLLLLDEPMSNLDYKVRLELRHELRALQRRIGITAVYVTHDREEALTLADRIAVIDAGRIVQIGAPEEVFHRPATRVRRRLHGRRQRARPDRSRRRRAGGRGRRHAGGGARCARTFAATRRARHAQRPATRPTRWCCRASSRRRSMSATAIAIACAPTAPKSGSTRPERDRGRHGGDRRRPARRRCCCFRESSIDHRRVRMQFRHSCLHSARSPRRSPWPGGVTAQTRSTSSPPATRTWSTTSTTTSARSSRR